MAHVMELEPYYNLHDVVRYALKIKAQNKVRRLFVFKGYYSARGTSYKGLCDSKSVSKPQIKSEVNKGNPLGHIAYQCPNRKLIALVEKGCLIDEIVDENDKYEVEYEPTHEEEVVYIHVDQGQSLIVQRNLKVSPSPLEDNCLRTDVFHIKCKPQEKTCFVIIDSGSFENCFSIEMVQKLTMKTVPNPKLYRLCWLQRGNEIKVKEISLISFSVGLNYKDYVWCNVVPMDACHLLLWRPWQYAKRCYLVVSKIPIILKKNGHMINTAPMQPMLPLKPQSENKSFLLNKAQLEDEIRFRAIIYALVIMEDVDDSK